MIVEVDPIYPPYGKTELNVERVIAMSPEKRRIYFEYVYWGLSDEDYEKVAFAWKQLFNR